MNALSRARLRMLSLTAWGVAAAGTLFCAVQIYRTAQLPLGDGSGMQWIILAPVALLFGFVVVPAAITGLRGARLLSTTEKVGLPPASQREAPISHTTEAPRVLPGRGWVIALGLVLIYFLLPFIVAPLLGLLMGE